MAEINLCIVGVGNCASSLVQGIHYYRFAKPDAVGLMHQEIGGYLPSDLRVVAAFDIDRRKVGADVSEAIFAEPNCTAVFAADVPHAGVAVQMGPVLDGIAPHMCEFPPSQTFVLADAPEPDRDEVVECLRATGAQVLVNYLPVGSEAAARFYAECALEAGVAVVNCMPVFIASDPVLGAALRGTGPADRRRRHQGPARRDHHAPHAHRPVPHARASSSIAPTSSTPAATPTSSTCSSAAG